MNHVASHEKEIELTPRARKIEMATGDSDVMADKVAQYPSEYQ